MGRDADEDAEPAAGRGPRHPRGGDGEGAETRYLVGDDAERLVAGRQRLTDEEYVATGRAMPDAEYLDLMRRRYGFEW